MAKAATRKAEELGLVAAAKKKQAEAHGARLHLVDETPAPRPAATVLLLRDDPLRVLLVQRPGRGAFPSVLAFPGGSAEPDDVDAATTAARETLEEVGVVLDPGELVPWSRWITPEQEPGRFDTRFFAARAPEDAEPRVDGIELVAARWAEPADALRRREAGDWPIIAPTAFQLHRLAVAATVAEALESARGVPDATIRPVLAEGTVRIPSGAGYPLTELPWR
ncbi:NUDIX hydrolase [Pseudolysinimonas sp.]|uniref:NUDIX hydrolase n=1 Tax=Pseudolysinimonas sp. TaxID=2680009 RepID=UPI003F7D2447